MTHATKPCDKCGSEGTVLRHVDEIRKLPNGELDPMDLRRRETCDRCGGGGRIREDYVAVVPDKVPGFIADLI